MKRPHFALPEIYDDSLSYYDVLRKLIKSIHVISDNLNKIPEQIANEAKARLLGDQNLQQNINSEATTREQDDITLQQNITAEASARETADNALQEKINTNKNDIRELKGDLTGLQSTILAKMDSYTVKTVMDSVATPHTQYYLGNQTSVDIVLPDTANVGQIITVCWYNGETAATLSITGTMLEFDYIPSANTRSEINALWDGTYWAILSNEMEVPTDAETA